MVKTAALGTNQIFKSRETAPRDGPFGNDDSETKAPDVKAHQLEYSRRGFHEGTWWWWRWSERRRRAASEEKGKKERRNQSMLLPVQFKDATQRRMRLGIPCHRVAGGDGDGGITELFLTWVGLRADELEEDTAANPVGVRVQLLGDPALGVLLPPPPHGDHGPRGHALGVRLRGARPGPLRWRRRHHDPLGQRAHRRGRPQRRPPPVRAPLPSDRGEAGPASPLPSGRRGSRARQGRSPQQLHRRRHGQSSRNFLPLDRPIVAVKVG
uniref:Uncharacterized protein n=1 Tax=Zea mays TaxID=4577 RepID=A0A804MFJ2_MAIZE